MNTSLALTLIALGLLGSAYYSGLETGSFSINRLRLRHLVRAKVKGADILENFLKHPDHLLGTTLVGNNICNQLTSVVALSLGMHLGDYPGYLAGYVLITLVMLIAGEYVPKAWFQGDPSSRILPFMPSLKFWGVIFYPVAVVVTWFAKILVPVPSKKSEHVKPFITLEEIKHLSQVGEQSGSLTKEERRMIEKVLNLTQKPCRAIMIVREDMMLVHGNASAPEILDMARTRSFSRFPVLDDDTHRFIGIVNMFDVLAQDSTEDLTAINMLRAPQFVDEEMPCDEVLTRMRTTRQPMALVTDDRNEVIGMITSEMILEEIVGQL